MQTSVQTSCDVLIVGGGFAGLAAATQIARARRDVIVVDAGRPRNRFATASHGFLSRDGINPSAFTSESVGQLRAYPSASQKRGEVQTIERRGGMFHATLQEIEIVAARIVLAYGVIDELPQIEGLQAKWGAGVLHCPYCHGFEVADQRLASLWTGEASLHQVKILKDWSDSVVLLANGAEMSDEAKKELDARKIAVDFRPVRRVRGPGNNIESVEFEDGNALPVDALFLISRVRLASDLAERLGCKLTEGPFGPYVITNDLRETSEQGIYAAGDMARPIHNATWAASDGVMAGIFCHQSLIVGANPYAARAR